MIHSETIKSFDEYLAEVSKLADIPEIISLFRGQSEKKPLLPSIARRDNKKNTAEIEKHLLEDLKRRNASQNSFHLKDDWDWLVFAQHYGLKTRLLDWTTNPISAIWFACNNNKDNDAFVYMFLANKGFILNKEEDKNPFIIKNTKVIRPPQNNERIIAQSGWFTAHTFSTGTQSFVPLESNNLFKEIIVEVIIPKELKSSIVKKCHLFGINNQTMFPDMEGICRQINWENNL